MFYGTRFPYKLLYFVTAMSPAYFLFLLQLNHKFNGEIEFMIKKQNVNVYHLCCILFLLIISLSLILKFLINRQFKKGRGYLLLNNELGEFDRRQIDDSNGNIISFLLGTIIPAVLIIETSLIEAVIVFVILQVIIFILVNKSNEIFPNIMLIILGIDICKMASGKYLLILKGNNREISKVIQLGNPSKSKLFITSLKK